MKVAFFFDTFLLKDKNNNYWGMTLTYEFFKKRYLSVFDEVTVITREKDKETEKGNITGYKKTNGEGIHVDPIQNYKDIPDAIKNKKKIQKEIEEKLKNVDKAIIRMPSVIGMFACESCIKSKKPYMIEMVACPWDGYLNHARLGGKILAPIMTLLTKKYVKKAPKVLYVTNEFLQKRYPTKGEKIACSDVLLNENNDDILNKRINKMQNAKNLKLATVASVELKYKGQEYVIRAISELKKKNINFEYYLIGGGNNERLKKIAQKYEIDKNVHFVGSVNHEEVFKLLQEVDIYIQPSLQEGLPRALIEAMSVACPAIGSDVGGIPELLDSKFIFKKKNVKQIKNILINVDIGELKEQSRINYRKSKMFNRNILERKRMEFYTNI